MTRLRWCPGILLIVLSTSRVWADPQDFEQIEKGRYLATVGDCVACHTAPGGKPFAGGLPIATPFGRLVSPNITPDQDTGIGAWTDDDFIRAMRKGVGRNGEHLYPAFPYPYFATMNRDDVVAVRRYLATLDPVRNAVVSNRLPFPFRIRALMAVWNWLFVDTKEFAPTGEKSAEWNRGAYLVTGLGHCGDCHTAKNKLGADKTSETLRGGNLQGWFAPNLTNDPHVGVGAWSVDDIAAYLQTGHNKNAAASGPMAEVVADSTSHLNDADLRAIAVYLKDQPGGSGKSSTSPPDKTVLTEGQQIFQAQCGACHQASGAGVRDLFPGLAGAPDVQSNDFTNLLRVVLEGGKSVVTDRVPTGAAMPAFDWKLSEKQIAAVATYVRNEWGNTASAVSASDVAATRREMRQ